MDYSVDDLSARDCRGIPLIGAPCSMNFNISVDTDINWLWDGGLLTRGRGLSRLMSIHFCRSSFSVFTSAASRFLSTFDFINCDVSSFTFAGFSLAPDAEAGLLYSHSKRQSHHQKCFIHSGMNVQKSVGRMGFCSLLDVLDHRNQCPQQHSQALWAVSSASLVWSAGFEHFVWKGQWSRAVNYYLLSFTLSVIGVGFRRRTQFQIILVTDPPAHKQTGPIKIHCTTSEFNDTMIASVTTRKSAL